MIYFILNKCFKCLTIKTDEENWKNYHQIGHKDQYSGSAYKLVHNSVLN